MDNLRKQADMTQRICSVADCARPHRAMGYCESHYAKLRTVGQECSVEGCERKPKAVGLCSKHYYGQQPCSIEGCVRSLKAKGLCHAHYRHADVGGTCQFCGEAFGGDRRRIFCSPECKAASGLALPVDYAGAHRRIRVELGTASRYPCVDCGDSGQHWSYNNTDPAELRGRHGSGLGLPYSLDSAHYSPRCASCHKLFDMRYEGLPIPT